VDQSEKCSSVSELGYDSGITDQLQIRWNDISYIIKQIDGI
jgi:hypothetical protein